MKILRDLEQGSAEWFQARSGVITASHAHDAIKWDNGAKTGKNKRPPGWVASTGTAYVSRLAGEIHLGKPFDSAEATKAMERGADMEAEARLWLAFHLDVDIDQVGLVVSDCGRFAASPDGVVAEAAGVEIFCPMAQAMSEILQNPELLDKRKRLQSEMGMWVSGWTKWYGVAYCPGFPTLVRPYDPDPAIQAAFDIHLPALRDRVDAAVETIKAMEQPADADYELWKE